MKFIPARIPMTYPPGHEPTQPPAWTNPHRRLRRLSSPWTLVLLCAGMVHTNDARADVDSDRPKNAPDMEVGLLASAKPGEEEAADESVTGTMSRALKQADAALARAAEVGRRIAFRFKDGGGPRTFVLPGAAMSPETADSLSEDLAVMARILEKTTEGGTEAPWAILGGRWPGGGRDLDALYLDGFGALFLLRVEFPLVAPAEKPTEKPAEEKDRVWEEARKELQGGRRQVEPRWFLHADGTGPEARFDAQRVENLEREILRALKHASNLRGVAPNESVVVSVFGSSSSGAGGTVAFSPDGRKLALSSGGGNVRIWNVPTGEPASETPTRSSVLTFRVGKKDIDEFAGGKIDADRFASKVQIGVR